MCVLCDSDNQRIESLTNQFDISPYLYGLVSSIIGVSKNRTENRKTAKKSRNRKTETENKTEPKTEKPNREPKNQTVRFRFPNLPIKTEPNRTEGRGLSKKPNRTEPNRYITNIYNYIVYIYISFPPSFKNLSKFTP